MVTDGKQPHRYHIDSRSFNGYILPTTFPSRVCSYTTISEDLWHRVLQMSDSNDIIEMEFLVMNEVLNTISGQTKDGIRIATLMFRTIPTFFPNATSSSSMAPPPIKRHKTGTGNLTSSLISNARTTNTARCKDTVVNNLPVAPTASTPADRITSNYQTKMPAILLRLLQAGHITPDSTHPSTLHSLHLN